MVSQITLKPHVPLCRLLYLYVLEIPLFALKFMFAQQIGIKPLLIYIYNGLN